MILVDTSIWIDHLRAGDAILARLLHADRVLTHPFVIGEIALGNLQQRTPIMVALNNLPKLQVTLESEVLHFIDANSLFGLGIGYIDAHLLAATRLSAGATLWTRGKRLSTVADRLGLAAHPTL